jgi:general secretion pathway protein F
MSTHKPSPLSIFRVSAIDMSGKLVSKNLPGATADAVKNRLAEEGLTVVGCESVGEQAGLLAGLASVWRSTGQAAIEPAAFSQDLATLIGAGVSVKDAVEVVARRASTQSARLLLEAVSKSIEQGNTLSASLYKGGGFPDILIATIAASEQTGDLTTGLTRYAEHQHKLQAVKDKVKSALVYPMFLVATGSVVVAMLLGVVVPRFSTLIRSTGQSLPYMSELLLQWGRFARENPSAPVLLLSLFGVAVVWILAALKRPQTRNRWLAKLPWLSPTIREYQHMQVYRTSSILVSRGIPFPRALNQCSALLGPTDQMRLENALQEMRNGLPISQSLEASGFADALATSMLGVAEKSGELTDILDRIADLYERALQRKVDLITRLVEPTLMLVFGTIIGGIVLIMYMPIFDLSLSVS